MSSRRQRKWWQQILRVKFLFIGDGSLRQELERQIIAAKLQRYFVFTGLVPPATIPQYVGAMDLLVHASLRRGSHWCCRKP